MFSLKNKLPSLFIKKFPLIVLLLVYLGILVAIYLASPPPGQAVSPNKIFWNPGAPPIPLVASIYTGISFILVALAFTLRRKS